MKNLLLLILMFVSSSAFAEAKFMKNTVPHYYQYTNAPSGVYACGHTALKSAAKYVSGIDKSLSDLHSTMWYNSAEYRNKTCKPNFCARLLDLEYAAKLSQNGGYGLVNTVRRSVPDYTALLAKVKDGVINDLPPVAESRWDISFGHFYVIVGYEDTGDAATSILYLRDVLQSSPTYVKYDTYTTVQNFHDNMDTKQVLFVKRNN